MTAYHGEENWGVTILKICNKTRYRGFFRDMLRVSGKARVDTGANGRFIILDFNYRGSVKANPKKLYDHIRALAVTVRYNNMKKEENTLENHIERLINNGTD